MSTLKADAVTSAQDNTALTLSGTGTGGVKVNDFFVQTKGADIASGTTLTLGKDGNQFDVTGTTTITGIATQGIGSYVTLHFDGVLTFTHHSTNLILPGAANITTAAGDIAVMYEYASADWRCVSYTKASGAAVVASSAGLTLIETLTPSGAATATFTAAAIFDGTYDRIIFELTGISPATDAAELTMTVSDDDGATFESANYVWFLWRSESNGATFLGNNSASDSAIDLIYNLSNAADETAELTLSVGGLSGTAAHKNFYGRGALVNANSRSMVCNGAGHWGGGTTAIDQIRFLASSGNISFTGRAYGVVNS